MAPQKQVSLAHDTNAMSWRSIKDAIEHAWAHTKKQMDDTGYYHKIRRDSFGQFLVANIRHFVLQLGGLHDDLTVDLRTNRRGTAYHVVIEIGCITTTISAVPDKNSGPRFAHFRLSYATRQLEFMYNPDDNIFKVPQPPSAELLLRGEETWYYQILHGPKPGDRELLGFIVMAPVNIFGEYIHKSMDLDEFAGKTPDGHYVEASNTHPIVEVDDELQVKPKEVSKCPEEQEVQGSRVVG